MPCDLMEGARCVHATLQFDKITGPNTLDWILRNKGAQVSSLTTEQHQHEMKAPLTAMSKKHGVVDFAVDGPCQTS